MDGGNNNNNGRAVLEGILCRLSVKDLLKFRSVCRAWKNIIDREDFKKKHFETAKQINTKAPTILIVKRSATINLNEFEIETNLHYCCPKYWSTILIVNNRQQPFNLAQFLDHTTARELMGYMSLNDVHNVYNNLLLRRIESVNGLVCLSWDDLFYVIWNPSTNQYKTFKAPPAILQNCHLRSENSVLATTAFGFDPVFQDYMFFYGFFIPLLHMSNGTTKVVHRLYSLRNDSWLMLYVTYLSHMVIEMVVNGDGYTDNGKFYWFVKHSGSTLTPALLCFDFCIAQFRFVSLPQEFQPVYQAIAVGNCKDVELLMTFKYGSGPNLRCEVWQLQMNEDELLVLCNIKCRVELPLQIGRPIGLIKGSGEMMFQASVVGDHNHNKELLLINPRTQSRINLGFTAPNIMVSNFVNTLLSVNPPVNEGL